MIAAGLLAVAAAEPLRSQTVPPAQPASTDQPASAEKNDAAIQLSPFEVRAEDDSGYQAANTTSGSRLNSRLKDTPAAVSPFNEPRSYRLTVGLDF